MNEIDELLQLMRTMQVSQVRRQMEHDRDDEDSYYNERFWMVRDFFRDAKEQQS